jgi:hypothetical protein
MEIRHKENKMLKIVYFSLIVLNVTFLFFLVRYKTNLDRQTHSLEYSSINTQNQLLFPTWITLTDHRIFEFNIPNECSIYQEAYYVTSRRNYQEIYQYYTKVFANYGTTEQKLYQEIQNGDVVDGLDFTTFQILYLPEDPTERFFIAVSQYGIVSGDIELPPFVSEFALGAGPIDGFTKLPINHEYPYSIEISRATPTFDDCMSYQYTPLGSK